jgi:hypothetical protein
MGAKGAMGRFIEILQLLITVILFLHKKKRLKTKQLEH